MVRVTDDPALSPDDLTLYHASDPLLGHLPVLVFHGSSTTANHNLNSSRIQIHVLSPAGFQSFQRVTISPSSPYYSVVNYLPREVQVDEIYRGLAFGLFKYFSDLSNGVKLYLKNIYPTRAKRPGSTPVLFGEQHAADLVQSMVKSDLTAEVITSLQDAFQAQYINHVDIDLVLPPGAIVPLQPADMEDVPDNEDDILDPTLRQYSGYTPLIKLLGEPIFLPTSKLRRAPSKPTSLNRGRTFTKEQKYDLRMKLAELVDTEERYVMKLRELVHSVAKEFRENSRARSEGSSSPSEEELERLFPSSADRILQLNSAFVQQLRRTMDDSEESALRDMEQTTAHLDHLKSSQSTRPKDPTGALSMARLFNEWFPKFTQSYQDYIKASQHFPTLLNSFLDHQSSFKQRVLQSGEQTIRSILIEPVQRLPRYSLLIDQIIGSLPLTHPALQPMLKARDIITNICSMDDPLPDKPHVANRLRNLVESWPKNFEPEGRVVAAADVLELAPQSQDAPEAKNSDILLLFPECVLILRKTTSAMTGRDLLREIDKPSAAELLISMTNAAGGPSSYQFAFVGWYSLADVRFTESADGSLIWMTSTTTVNNPHEGRYKTPKAATSRCFLLQESFEGRSSRWCEDVAKARIEARFSEAEREDPCWTLRSVRMQDNNLVLHMAVFQEGAHQLVEGRREPAPIRIVVDHEKGTKGAPVGHYGVEIAVNLSSNNMKRMSLLTAGLKGRQFQDDVDLDDLMSVLSRRFIQLLSSHYDVSNPELTGPLVSYYTKTLRGLKLSSSKAEKTRSFLTASPVKLFSSLWHSSNGATNNEESTPGIVVSGVHSQRTPSLHRSNSFQSMFGSIRGKDSRPNTADEKPENPLFRLEQTFTGFVAALQSRKGAIVGRSLLNRSFVDELIVNDIYNRLIESPFDFETAPETGTEAIFVAFEKFLHIAWARQIGPVMTMHAMDTLLERANKRVPGDFADFVKFLFREMAPQNRRALVAIIKLLADLLDGCDNDSDRGALTVAFSELLVTQGDAHNYINLLDRLVQDSDRIVNDANAGQDAGHDENLAQSNPGSLTSSYRYGKAHTGSLTSNASSLRRKFGLDAFLHRDERPSMWRTLSKHRNPATGDTSSLSRGGNMDGGQSMDDNSFPKRSSRRGTSRDRPTLAGAFDEHPGRPASSHRLDFPLDTIGEPSSVVRPAPKTLKKKRRSSLSDLKGLMASATLDDVEAKPLQAATPTTDTAKTNNVNSKAPLSPVTSVSPVVAGGFESSKSKEKENLGSPSKVLSNAYAPATVPRDPVFPSKTTRHIKALSVTAIPTLRQTKSTSGIEQAARPDSPTRPIGPRVRVHSSQKLKERLDSEMRVAQEVDSSLKTELAKIGDEIALVNQARSPSSQVADMNDFAISLGELEKKIQIMMQALHGKQADTHRDFDTALKSAESKVRAIDQLHKEVVAENELLYEKYNGELSRIIKAVKGKTREDKDELVAKLRDQSEETARMKKENARLKRELVSLRAMMRGTG